MNKQGKMKAWHGFALGGVVIAAILALAWYSGNVPNNTSGSLSGNVVGGGNAVQQCSIQPTLAFSYVDKYNGTALTPSTTKLYVNGQLSSCSSSPCNVDVGSAYSLTVHDGQHYYSQANGVVQSCGSNTVQLPANPNATLTNTSADKYGTVGSKTAITTTDIQIAKLDLVSSPKKTFSNPLAPNNPIICTKMNTTELTGISLVGGVSVSTPNVATANSETDCWQAPFKSLTNGEESGFLSFSLSSGSTEPAGATCVTGHVYDQDYFVSTDGSIKSGVNDDTGSHADVGGSNPAFSICYS